MDIFNIFHLECARRLPHLPAEHPCSRVHGHSFRIELHVSGPLDEKRGWVLDFADVDKAWAPIKAALDHRYLNDIDGLDNPTSEILAIWIWDRLKPALPGLSKIVVQETAASGCIYQGPALSPSPSPTGGGVRGSAGGGGSSTGHDGSR